MHKVILVVVVALIASEPKDGNYTAEFDHGMDSAEEIVKLKEIGGTLPLRHGLENVVEVGA